MKIKFLIILFAISTCIVNAQNNSELASAATKSETNIDPASTPEKKPAANSCSAKSSGVGGSCSVSCPQTQTPKCSSSFWSTSCFCEGASSEISLKVGLVVGGGSGSDNGGLLHFYTSAQVALTTDFISFLNSLGSVPAKLVAMDVKAEMNAAASNNVALYIASAEKAAMDMALVSPSDKEKINQWLSSRGVTERP